MKALLIFPPQWSPWQPYLSLPTLASYALNKGHDISITDVNIEYYHYALKKEYLTLIVRKLKDRAKQINTYNKDEKYIRQLIIALAISDHTIKNINNALNVFHKDKEFYDIENRNRSIRIINHAFFIISTYFYPTTINTDSFKMKFSYNDSKQVYLALSRKNENPYYQFLKKYITRNALNNFDCIGISIVTQDQFIPAMMIAKLIKKIDNSIHIVIGGPFVSLVYSAFLTVNPLNELIDSIVTLEGETAFNLLLNSLEKGKSLSGIPNLLHKNCEGFFINNDSFYKENLDDLYCPEYGLMPLNLYLSPKIVYSIETSRGCYWNKCTFCNIVGIDKKNFYRSKDPSFIMRDIRKLKKNLNAYFFSFSDNGTEPSNLIKISQMLVSNNIDIRWYTQIRVDKIFGKEICNLMYESGCRHLFIGVETVSTKILKLMNKGINIAILNKMKDYLTDANISINLGFIIDFPLVTVSDNELNRDFIDSIKTNSKISFVYSKFQITKNSYIFKHPEKFGITYNTLRNEDCRINYKYDCFNSKNGKNSTTEKTESNNPIDIMENDKYGPHYLLYQEYYNDSSPKYSEKINEIQKNGIRIRFSKDYKLIDSPHKNIYFSIDNKHSVTSINYIYISNRSGRVMIMNEEAKNIIDMLKKNLNDSESILINFANLTDEISTFFKHLIEVKFFIIH
ncbi:MAG: cobalamin-dependent protein [Candidatus Delongbacteria bacterium]|nr:cobalamin-dependent protein [Candidatus Delongbacteria bacterium]